MQKVAILYDASQAILSTFQLDEVLRRILTIMTDYFHLDHVAILLMDETRNELYVRSHNGWVIDPEAVRIPLGQGITGSAARERRPIHCPDVTADPRYIRSMDSTRSEVAIPLVVRETVVGVLDCQSDTPNFFDNETIDLLILFSTQASIALQNARLYSQERRKAMQLEAINGIARQTTSVLDVRELLDKVCELVLHSFEVDHVSVLLADNDALVLRAHKGKLNLALVPEIPMPADSGLYGRAFKNSFPVLENDIQAEAEFVPVCEGARSELCLPLITMGEASGVMVLDNERPNAFDPAEVGPLQSVADICAGAIQNAHYFEHVRQLAYKDGLTGVFNRRYFELRILEEIARAQRCGGEVSVLMIDVDGFKKLNDEFGHLLGDEVLREVSTLFQRHLRKSDVLCRFGGDEFAVLLPDSGARQAAAVAEKLRNAIGTTEFRGVARPVTISVGLASSPANGHDRDELIKAADNALYAAKQAGRNRVGVSTAAAPSS